MSAAPEVRVGLDDRPVLVLDFGAQYAQLIARRVRECRVRSELVPHDITPEEVLAKNPYGLILSGGPASIYADGAPRLDPRLLELGIPVLGICYGMQAMAQALGGEVARTGTAEFGKTELSVLGGVMLHDVGDVGHLLDEPQRRRRAPARRLRRHRLDAVDAGRRRWRIPSAGFYAVQFHPEVGHTPRGTDMLKNFLSDACHAPATWTALAVIDEQVELIRAQVGDARVICGLSGGVDSAVAALLVYRAIGDQLTCVFVDHGLHAPERVRAGRRDVRQPLPGAARARARRPSASSRNSRA